MDRKLILGIAALCVVCAFLAGRHFPADVAPAGDLAADAVPAADPGGDRAPQLDSQRQVIQRLTAELDAARQATAELEAKNEALRTKLASAGGEPAGGTGGTASAGPAYAPEKYKAAVADVVWPEAGEAAAKMVPLLDELAAGFGSGKPMRESIGLEIFKWNQKLQTLAVTAITKEVPGAAGNGAFTHPVVTINLIHAALADAGLPLHESQIKELREIGDRYIEDDLRRTAGYNEETFALQKLIDECALKDRMFAEIHGILTPKQSDVLHPESIRGRMGIDIYSSGTMWYAVAKPVDFSTREDIAAGLVQQYMAQTKLSEEEAGLLRRAVKDWADGFSEEYLRASADPVAQASRQKAANGMLAGWQKIEQATTAASHQLALNRALFELVREDAVKAAQVRADTRVFIPIQRP